jgi:hypothetical protein
MALLRGASKAMEFLNAWFLSLSIWCKGIGCSRYWNATCADTAAGASDCRLIYLHPGSAKNAQRGKVRGRPSRGRSVHLAGLRTSCQPLPDGKGKAASPTLAATVTDPAGRFVLQTRNSSAQQAASTGERSAAKAFAFAACGSPWARCSGPRGGARFAPCQGGAGRMS